MSVYISIPDVDQKSLQTLVPSTLHELWNPDNQGSAVNLAIEDFGISVKLHYTKDDKTYLHLGIVKEVCSSLSIPYPARQVKFQLREATVCPILHGTVDDLLNKQSDCNRMLACLRNVDAMIRMQSRVVAEWETRCIDSLLNICVLNTTLDHEEDLWKLRLIRSIINVETQVTCAYIFNIS